MEFSYFTIEKPVEPLILKEKGSKFIPFAFPVNSEQDIQERLNEVRQLHPKATHHCYAFRLGISGENYRANDDGEPSGSAGLPIYNQILGQNLTQILVVVVRYYGGTKLGVGGLTKIYKESAKAILESAKIVKKELHQSIELSFDYSYQSQVYQVIHKFDLKINNLNQQLKIALNLDVPARQYDEILLLFKEMKGVEIL